jgi:hypothetical protein
VRPAPGSCTWTQLRRCRPHVGHQLCLGRVVRRHHRAWLNPLAAAPTIDGSRRHRPVPAGDRPTVKRAAPGLSLVDYRERIRCRTSRSDVSGSSTKNTATRPFRVALRVVPVGWWESRLGTTVLSAEARTVAVRPSDRPVAANAFLTRIGRATDRRTSGGLMAAPRLGMTASGDTHGCLLGGKHEP